MNKLLVRSMLEHFSAFYWTLQGFGMLRTYINKEVRLHVWDSRYAVPNVSTIHTHPWDFVSTVIAGSVCNTRFEEDKHLSRRYKRQTIKCGEGGGKCGSPQLVHMYSRYPEVIREGETYTQHADEIHSSAPEDGTVTVVERKFKSDTEHAYVYWPDGTEWVSAEPRPATHNEALDITSAALAKWF